jgi:opacity protein-like surface antigen
MKRLFAACVALLAPAGMAAAADLYPAPYYRAPSPAYAVPLFTWTGFYVGLNGGGARKLDLGHGRKHQHIGWARRRHGRL